MKIIIEINTENDAFEKDRDGEVCRILREFSDNIFAHGLGNLQNKPLTCITGFSCGTWKVVEHEQREEIAAGEPYDSRIENR